MNKEDSKEDEAKSVIYTVKQLATALIREFCLKNNFLQTLKQLDAEDSGKAKIRKQELIKRLSLEKTYKEYQNQK